ncbi:MAG: hypothetical protein ACHQ0J_01820 [Candidatus Dormibacterales bacterium]
MRIDVHFTRGDLWFDLGTKPYELTDGLKVRLRENFTRNGIAAHSDFGHFLVERAEGVPIDVAVALLSSWLYEKLRRHKAKITIDRTEIEVNDEGKVKKLIKEHIEKEP